MAIYEIVARTRYNPEWMHFGETTELVEMRDNANRPGDYHWHNRIQQYFDSAGDDPASRRRAGRLAASAAASEDDAMAGMLETILEVFLRTRSAPHQDKRRRWRGQRPHLQARQTADRRHVAAPAARRGGENVDRGGEERGVLCLNASSQPKGSAHLSDPFSILGVDENATDEEIKRRYLAMVRPICRTVSPRGFRSTAPPTSAMNERKRLEIKLLAANDAALTRLKIAVFRRRSGGWGGLAGERDGAARRGN